MINSYFKFPIIEAVELFSAGFCNLNCSYCYIPKTPMLKELHAKIIKKIENGKFLEELKEIYGNDLTSISHWGTEPTLTIRKFKNFYNEALKTFPKLKTISLSSNFMTDPANLIKFITEDLTTEKALEIKIQVSLDGPEWITEKNRGKNTTQLIINHTLEATKEISSKNKIHNIYFHVKPTVGSDNISELANYQKVKEYYEFFDDFLTKWIEQVTDKKTSISNNCDPTIVLPYDYTKQDGLNFSDLVKNQVELQQNKYKSISIPESNYYQRLQGKLKSFKEFFTKQKMFTCSSGDSMIGISEKLFEINSCHRTFFINHPEYEKSAETQKLDSLTMNGIKLGRNKLLLQLNTCNTTDNFSVIKMLYNNRAYNDFAKHKHSTGVAIAIELSKSGQISKCYSDPNLAYLLAILVQTSDCPMDNIVTSGSSLIPSLPIYRLFGNGAAENIFSRLLKRRIE
jgi:sulfatase maturation enzyme AslB (radical SAM superfamily)